MAQYYDKLTFSDYTPTELLGSDIYNDSIKRLSFQYRTRNEEKLIAYIALSQDKPNIEIPNVENQMNGCRILGVYAENYQVGHYQVTDLILLEALLDEAEYYIRGWVNTQNGEFQFNYLWLNLSDFDSQDIIERIDGLTFINGIAYKVIERNEQPNQWLLICANFYIVAIFYLLWPNFPILLFICGLLCIFPKLPWFGALGGILSNLGCGGLFLLGGGSGL